jgi:hypothetical protein
MNHERRGLAIIFNNEIFVEHSTRFGTNVDRQSLKETLKNLDFQVNVYDNLNRKDIMKIVKDG